MGEEATAYSVGVAIPFFTEKTMTMFLIGGAIVFVFGASLVIGIILERYSG